MNFKLAELPSWDLVTVLASDLLTARAIFAKTKAIELVIESQVELESRLWGLVQH